MKELVCKLQPFDLMQTVFVIEDNKQKNVIKIPTKEFVDRCFNLWSEYKVDQIKLKGHKKYAMGLKAQLEKTAKIAYSENNIKVILSR